MFWTFDKLKKWLDYLKIMSWLVGQNYEEDLLQPTAKKNARNKGQYQKIIVIDSFFYLLSRIFSRSF